MLAVARAALPCPGDAVVRCAKQPPQPRPSHRGRLLPPLAAQPFPLPVSLSSTPHPSRFPSPEGRKYQRQKRDRGVAAECPPAPSALPCPAVPPPHSQTRILEMISWCAIPSAPPPLPSSSSPSPCPSSSPHPLTAGRVTRPPRPQATCSLEARVAQPHLNPSPFLRPKRGTRIQANSFQSS